MNGDLWIDPRIKQVGAAALESYLTERGWKRVPHPRQERMVFEAAARDDDGEPFVIAVPSSERFRDFLGGALRAIEALSIIEGRHPVQVLNDILKMNPRLASRPATKDGANGPLRPGRRRR